VRYRRELCARDSHLNPEGRGEDGKVRSPSPNTESQFPKTDTTSQQGDGVRGRLRSVVAVGTPESLVEKTLHAVFHAVAEALFLLDRDGGILTCNDAAAKQLVQGVQGLVGLTLSDCLAIASPADAHEQYTTRFAEVLQSALAACAEMTGVVSHRESPERCRLA
jgi:PAS domain-containing protein